MISFPNEHGYDYTFTHVDDFKIFTEDFEMYLNNISKVLFVKSHGTQEYHLVNDFNRHDENVLDVQL